MVQAVPPHSMPVNSANRNSLEPAFLRRERIQAPNIPRVAPHRDPHPVSYLPKDQNELDEAKESRPITTKHGPWNDYCRLGEFVASGIQLGCTRTKVVMFKKMIKDEGVKEHEVLQTIEHPNIIRVQAAFIHDNYFFLGLEYCRYTLEEMLLVPLKIEECHLQYIACSLFRGIQCIAEAGFLHNMIDLQSVRLCGRTCRVVLSNFERATKYKTGVMPNTDLEKLGFVLLQCMNGASLGAEFNLAFIKNQRQNHKLYGVRSAENWSQHKVLIDFLDELLWKDKLPTKKLESKHPFVAHEPVAGTLDAHIELINFSCFTPWQPHVHG